MVMSCLTMYAIVFYCFTLFIGKSFSAASEDKAEAATAAAAAAAGAATSRESGDRRGSKINFNVISKGNHSDFSRSPKVLQSFYLPSNHPAESISNDSIRDSSGCHSYFGLFHRRNASGNDKTTTTSNDLQKSFEISNRRKSRHRKNRIDWETESDWKRVRDFVVWDTLEDSEKEIRIHYNGITAKETVMATGVDEETGKRQGLKLRQLTDGLRFVQLIYNFDDQIQDCEYLREKNVAKKFLDTFRRDLDEARVSRETKKPKSLEDESKRSTEAGREMEEEEEDEGKIERYFTEPEVDDEEEEPEESFDGGGYRNVTFQIIRREDDLPEEFRRWMSYPLLKKKCRENHKILKSLALDIRHGNEEVKKLAEEHIESEIVPLRIPAAADIAAEIRSGRGPPRERTSGETSLRRWEMLTMIAWPRSPDNAGRMDRRSWTRRQKSDRRKRDIMDVFLVPGTKWCGKGRRATKYTSLGGFSRTDKCCRIHDTMCPHWIGSLEEKYELFNWRINTIMHCRCDKRFRACLKMAKTGTANFVGKLFFNVVQTKCFILKPKEVCLKYSWWGKCEKKEYRKQAHLRDNVPY